MFSFGEKGRFIPAVVFSIAVLASCSHSEGIQEIGISSCTPASASAGSEVACQTKSLEEDCTLFFGKQPIDFERDASDDSVSFTVPAIPAGEVNITARCGEGAPVVIQDGFVVLALSLNPEETTPEDYEEYANGDQVIAPSAPAPTPSDIPTSSPPSTAEQPSAGGEMSAALTVEKATGSAVHFATYRIDWNVANAKAVYLAGSVFTRFWMDKGLPNECGKSADGRFLVTNPEGSDLNPGSSNFHQAEPYREGAVCNEDNCASEILAEVPALTPFCRIDLTSGAGHVFVRNMAAQGRVCLAVQGSDDAWEFQCQTIQAPKPKLVVTDNSIAISDEKPVITLNFEYENAAGRPNVAGCTELSGLHGMGVTGKGVYQAECPLEKIKTKITVAVQGIGAGDVDSRSFEVVLWKNAFPSLKLYGPGPGPNQEGTFQLQYKVSRTYSVTEQKTGSYLGEFRNCPWVKEVYFEGFPSGDGNHTVTKLSDVEGIKDAFQDPNHVQWWFQVKDFDGQHESTTYKPGAFLNKNQFSLHAISGTGGMLEDDCSNGLVTLKHQFKWKGHNVLSFSIEDKSLFAATLSPGSEYPDAGPDKDDEGTLHVSQYLGHMNGEWDASLSFTLKVVFYDGETKDFQGNVSGYSCHVTE